MNTLSSLKLKFFMATAQSGSSSALEAFKSMSMKAGTYIRDASVKTGDAINEGTKSLRETKFAATASDTFSTIGTKAAEGGSYLYSMGNGVIGRFAAGSALTAECAKEAKESPCPRMVIMCCTALCANGLVHDGLFTDSKEAEAGAALYRELKSCNFSRLPDTSATPQVIAQALKLWLTEMEPEPLLTFKLVPALTSPETPRESLTVILNELPPANRTALLMLLDTCNRISGTGCPAPIHDSDTDTAAANNSSSGGVPATLADSATLAIVDDTTSDVAHPEPFTFSTATDMTSDTKGNAAINSTDAKTLATALAPCLLWEEAAAADPAATALVATQSQPLSAEQEAVFVRLLTYMITNFRVLQG